MLPTQRPLPFPRFLHPLHLAESRLVLQNRLPNFQTYKSLWTMFMTSYKELLRGVTAHIPRSFLLSMSKPITPR